MPAQLPGWTFRSENPGSDRFLPPCSLPRESKDQEAGRRPTTHAARRRRKGYCECCHEAFEELHGVSPSR